MRVLAALITIGAASSVQAQQWYNGDPDKNNGLSDEFNTLITDALLFENFSMSSGGVITDIYGNFFLTTNVTGYEYQFRSGVANGFGGTLIASGSTDGAWSVTPNGFDGLNMTGYRLAADIPDTSLAPGVYMLALAPVGDGTGRAFLQTTSGANAVGSPVNDKLNWFHSGHFGQTYNQFWNPNGDGSYAITSDLFDFSYGVEVVPAPGSAVLLAFVASALARRRR